MLAFPLSCDAFWLVGIFASLSSATLRPVKYGAFAPTAAFSIAQQFGLFAAYGLDVEYSLVPNSTYAYNSLVAGSYDILSGTSDNVINYRFNHKKPLTMLGQSQGPTLSVVSSLSIHSLQELKGKTLLVDADRKSTRLNSSHSGESRMPSSA